MSKIKEDQLNKIKEQQETTAKILNEIGFLESQKHQYLHNLADLNKEINDFKAELEVEYGSVTINLEDGSISEVAEEKETADVQ